MYFADQGWTQRRCHRHPLRHRRGAGLVLPQGPTGPTGSTGVKGDIGATGPAPTITVEESTPPPTASASTAAAPT